mmetsp:Transcript_44257/g.140831  ORF Transcript_44257/g.140831 Transcript_44257/m.140831 type:complete len:348 (-) Transcript_44257:91-1134(-)|eukprot:CAMPEP_0182887496 /NCGR_PEP_ID=MMETSP0034_2-20130328/20857_1 /TAXON_ID=156128 /ORGANISM="Nephroselmis pyriformis, Strain CCMP717" /LENGTH=347 /DNA_ID=CAMNT_0025020861 /DNA_START=262 /DNA_END=1308 /DNA_ORIENTATION=+
MGGSFYAALRAAAAELGRMLEAGHAEDEFGWVYSHAASQPTHKEMANAGVCTVALASIEKNRYSNIFPYDRELVRLEGGQYINASHITFPRAPEVMYIATQAPLHPDYHGPDTTPEFWAMVWEQRVANVVALAQVKPGYSGSSCYWPHKVALPKVYGNIRVTLIKQAMGPTKEFTVREFTVEGPKETDPPRRLMQYQFHDWPNYGVPDSPHSMHRFMREVDVGVREAWGCPMIVHCSGGVGRTGSFILTHALLTEVASYGGAKSIFDVPPAATISNKHLAALNTLTIKEMLVQFREARHPWMVEGVLQYRFAYDVVQDIIKDVAAKVPDPPGGDKFTDKLKSECVIS